MQVNEHCAEMFQSGKGNDIPPEAYKINEHIKVMIYTIMKFLSDGRGDKAKPYFMPIIKRERALNSFSIFIICSDGHFI